MHHDGWEDLRKCLSSLLPTVGPADEVLVVDNGSTDGSADLGAHQFPQVRWIRSPGNGGFGYGCNLGAAHARGQFLLFLNPDTTVEPGWLEPLLTALADPRFALVTPWILLMDHPAFVNTAGNEVPCTGLALCRGVGMPREAMAETAEVAAETVWAVSRRRGIPYVITHHNDLIGYGMRRYLFDASSAVVTPRVVGDARRILVVSRDHACSCRLSGLFRRRWADGVEVPNGVDTDRFRPGLDGKPIRRRYGIPDDARVVLFVGGLDRAHRFCLYQTLNLNRRNALARREREALGQGPFRSPLEKATPGKGKETFWPLSTSPLSS